MLKLGVLGVGAIATVDYGVLPNLHHIKDKVDLVALCDPVEERATDAAKRFGAAEVYGSLDAMLAESDIDAVLNLTPIPAHGATSLRILRAGKHLATEKPLATTMADADAIIEAAEAGGLRVVCSPPNMLYPTRIEAARLIREGVIGKVAFAKIRASHGGPASMMNWPTDPTWFYQEGSGPLMDVGVYGIHEALGLLGPARRVSAFSAITEPTRTVRSGPYAGKEITVTTDDNTLIMLDFGGGTFAVIDGTFNVNAAKGPRLEVFGRSGTLNLPNNLNQNGGRGIDLFRLDAAGGLSGWVDLDLVHLEPAQQRVDRLRRALLVDHLADLVAGTATPVMGADVARHALEIMLKAHESARAGRVLDLESTFAW
ncbi:MULTISPECIES: Gfo/Idh/MocA family protein [unclassified Streptosporangium]|uniref:Gfo/Idh/MocA family protein n=1 Tax=unclassified Streptosporangium TaxID=2632669 RepID=UPI002E2B5E58|nr:MULTISPECIES: Gfo/Idh/MocA family oxidoreductase [unclassified Streptosporangium]